MTEQTELRPCAHCGGPAEYTGGERVGYRVECRHCCAQSGWGDYGYQVEAKWNRRVLDANADAPMAELRQIQSCVERVLDESEAKDATIAKMARELELIRDQDEIEIALDPDWPRRIARAALEASKP